MECRRDICNTLGSCSKFDMLLVQLIFGQVDKYKHFEKKRVVLAYTLYCISPPTNFVVILMEEGSG